MEHWFTKLHLSIITKMAFGGVLSVFCVGGIIIVTILSFRQVERSVTGIDIFPKYFLL